ncbi:acyl-CoA dehydrogenase family protein [Pseudonocardia sp. NPDC049154]|uniref:acyl-CoA dehydrogenase family protein n=1 Tax=Pseudonocardia sp. NPDC049154 TaxID=3155501 RepID=UPI00340E5814
MTLIDDPAPHQVDGDFVDRARGLYDLISAEAPAAREQGRLTDAVAQAMKDIGVFWALVPEEYGGEPVDIAQYLGMLEELSRADPSAGWVGLAAGQGNGMISSLLPAENVRELLCGDPKGISIGHIAPLGKAVKVDGGYRVTGRWQFGSGASVATLIAGGSLVENPDGTPVMFGDMPELVFPMMPADQIELLGNWDVTGMHATASWDYAAKDVFVPEGHTLPVSRVLADPVGTCTRDEPIFRLGFMGRVYAGHSAVALGLMGRAFDEITRIVATKGRVGYATTIGESDVFRHEFAQREADYQAVRGYVYRTFRDVEDSIVAGNPLTPLDDARMNRVCAWMHLRANELVQWCASWAGSAAVREPSVIARLTADLDVMINHLYVDRANLIPTGGAILQAWTAKS